MGWMSKSTVTLLSLFVNDEQGYRNLIAIELLASEHKLTHADILAHNDGLTAVLPIESCKFHTLYKQGNEAVASWLVSFQAGFKTFYLGLPYCPDEPELLSFTRSFVTKYPYDTVAFPHFLYEKDKDAIVLDIVKAIQNEANLENKEATGFAYFLSEEQILSYYQDHEIFNSRLIAERAKFSFIAKRGGLLHYPNDLGLSSEDYLRKLANDGLARRVPNSLPTTKNGSTMNWVSSTKWGTPTISSSSKTM
jgi:DNA polymerase III alpha subunit